MIVREHARLCGNSHLDGCPRVVHDRNNMSGSVTWEIAKTAGRKVTSSCVDQLTKSVVKRQAFNKGNN